MNTNYRIVWNAASARWVVASELAKGRKKSSVSKGIAATAAALLMSAGVSVVQQARAAGLDGGSAKVTNVAKGTVDTDAVNVSQLKDVTSALGGGASVNADGTIQAPSYLVGGTAFSNVGSALTNLDGRTTANTAAITNATRYFKAGGKYDGTDDAYATAGSISIGISSSSNSNGSANQTAGGSESVALGNRASAGGGGSMALGSDANAYFTNMAIGAGAVADNAGRRSMALGMGARASAWDSVALGSSSTADRANTLSVGNATSQRQIVNMAKGTADTDAVNVSQLKGVTSALGGGAAVNADGSIKAPSYTVQGSTVSDVGSALTKIDTATTKNAGDISTINSQITNISNGGGIKYFHINSTAADSSATGGQSIAIGGNAKSTQSKSIAIGENASAVGDFFGYGSDGAYNIAIGAGAVADGSALNWARNTAVGGNAKASNVNDTALGYGTTASGGSSAALGYGASATVSGSVALGSNAVADRANTVSVGSATSQRQVVNVAKGTADTDAVNVSQLKGVTSALGGGAAVNADGSIKAPSYTVQGSTVSDVGSALTKIDTATTKNAGDISTINSQITNISNGKSGLVQQSAAGANLTVGAATDGAAVDFKGTAGARKLLNVAAGSLSAASTDAVNGSQLYATNQNVAGNTANIAQNTSDIAKNTTDIAGNTSSITTINSQITNISNGKSGLVQQSAAGANLTVGAATDGAVVDFKGTAGARKLLNVAAGSLSAASTDAVNGSQLFATNQQVTTNTNNIAQNTSDIAKNTTDIAGNTSSISTINSQITNINNGKSGLVLQSAAGANLTVGAATDGAAVDFKGTAGARKLLNVAAGSLSAASTDAVNGSQLFTTNQQVTTNTNNIAQNTSDISKNTTSITNLDGRVTQNTTDIAGNTSSINAINSTINNINNGKSGLVLQSAAGANLTVGAATDGAAVDFKGTAGARKLVNVAAGAVSSSSTDAVNGSQLSATNDRVTKNEGDITKIDGRVTKNEGDISTINTNVSNIDSRVTKNEGDISTIDSRVTTNEGDISTLNTHVSNIDSRVTNVEGSVSNITNQINNGEVGMVQQAAKGQMLTVGKDTDGVEVNFAGTAGARKLSGVAAGRVASDSQEAVNGSQLSATNDRVSKNEGDITNIDGRVTKNEGDISNVDSRVTKNEGDISNIDNRVTKNEGDISTINTNVSNIDNRVTNVEGSVSNITNQINNGEVGMVQQATKGQMLTVGKDTDGVEVNFAGTAGDRKLSGVAAGSADNDAVNVSQLKAAGLVDANGNALNAVSYDSADKDSVTMGGKGATKAVKIKNVADAEADDEAVNLAQLKKTGLVDGNGGAMDAVVYDAGSNKAMVTFGGANGTVLANVADGRIAAGSREAVNGGQIATLRDAMQSQITNIDSRVTNVDNRVTNVDNRVTKVEDGGAIGGKDSPISIDGGSSPANASGKDSIAVGPASQASGDNSVAIGTGSNASGNNSAAIGANSVADRDNTVSVGSAGNERQITNVAPGTAGTDAVNVNQLNSSVSSATTAANAYTDSQVNNVQSQVNGLRQDMSDQFHSVNNRVSGSNAMIGAMTTMTASLAGIDTENRVGAGTGFSGGQKAISVGYQRAIGKKANITFGATTTGSDTTVGVGAGIGW